MTVLLCVQWPDGTGCLMTRDEWARWDWVAFPAAAVSWVNLDDEAQRQRAA